MNVLAGDLMVNHGPHPCVAIGIHLRTAYGGDESAEGGRWRGRCIQARYGLQSHCIFGASLTARKKVSHCETRSHVPKNDVGGHLQDEGGKGVDAGGDDTGGLCK